MNLPLRNLVALSSFAVIAWASGCSEDPDPGNGTGGSDTTTSSSSQGSTGTTTTTTTTTTTSSGSGGSGGTGATGPGCDDVPEPPGPSNGSCVSFTSGAGGGGGTGGSGGVGVGGSGGSGGSDASGFYDCNPVTNEPCNDMPGAACDLSNEDKWVCFGSGNTEAICEACDNANGPWCQPGHTCIDGQCTRYCCTDADCGPSLVCDTSAYPDFGGEVGLCVP